MPEPVLKVDATGVKAASLQENVEGLNQRQRTAFGGDLAATPSTPQAQWGGIVGLGLAEVGEAGVRVSRALSVDDAEGTQLDVLGSPLDVRRLGATHSRVVATLTGVGGSVVSAGSRAKTADDDEFETETAVTLPNTGSVDVVMRSVETGAIEAAAGALDRIVTGVPGWETVTNAAAAVLGRPRQLDSVYRRLYRERTAHSSNGPITALRAALIEAGGTAPVVVHNGTNAAVVRQGWTVGAHAVLAIVEGGLDADINRAVENHRGMGAATVTAIVGGTLPTGGIAALTSPYEIDWRGTTFTVADGDWTGAADNVARATEITDAIGGDVTVAWTGQRFIAQYEWMQGDTTAEFDDGDMATALGLNPDAATESPGPFVRPVERALDVSFSLTRRAGFPADGLAQIQAAVLERVAAYAIGEEVWANDILGAAESVPGTRITMLSVRADSADISGVAVDLANKWTLEASGIAITVSP